MHTSDKAVSSPNIDIDPDQVLGFVLVRSYHAVGRRFHSVLAPLGLTPIQFGVLVAIETDSTVSQAQIARTVLVTPQSLGEMLRGMVERGLVDRKEPEGRGRQAQLRLTSQGRRLLRRAVPLIRAMNVPEAMGLSGQEHERLRGLLLKVLAHHEAG
jgi:DNA-binding MarR family transcriptional regulator